MFGTTIETFNGNRIVILILVLITLSLISVFFLADQTSGTEKLVISSIIILLVSLISWFLSIDIKIYSDGISSKTFFGKKEMRWDDVLRFTYSATKQRINFIPVGTYYDMKLESMQGQKIHIGNRATEMNNLSTHIINYTLMPLYNKIVDKFNNGADLDFGAIKLNRTSGFKARGLFRTIEVPLNQLIDYRIEKGQFYIFKQGKKYAAISAPIGKVPNAFALLELLNSIYKREAAAG